MSERGSKPTKLGLAILVSAIMLGSCQEPPKVTVFNNSGRELVLQLADDYLWEPTRTRIPAGRAKTLYWGRLARVAQEAMVIVQIGGCVLVYDPPPLDRAYFQGAAIYNPSTKVQVEPDLSVVLLPVTVTAIVPGARDLPLQAQYGFPLRPVSQTCEPAKP